MSEEMIRARSTQLKYYKVALYTKTEDGEYVLYKPEGPVLQDMRVSTAKYPATLYIKAEDKLKGLREVQDAFNTELRQHIATENVNKIKDVLVTVVSETLTEPRSGSLEGVSETVDVLAAEYASHPGVLRTLVNVYFKDYTTAVHSVNVMALVLAYSLFCKYTIDVSKTLGLAALLHDVGKTKVSQELIAADRRLTEDEFQQIKKHTTLGFEILKECTFSDKIIPLGALEHHERLDGSGYPRGISSVSLAGQIIGLVDCYEAITNDDRPYRSAMDPLDALALIKNEAQAGKFNATLFRRFAYSLTA